MTYKMVVPNYEQFNALKNEIEQEIDPNPNKDVQLEFKEAGLTMDIPKEIAPYISIEEDKTSMSGYHVVFVSPDTDEKELLFSIEIYSKDLYIPEHVSLME